MALWQVAEYREIKKWAMRTRGTHILNIYTK